MKHLTFYLDFISPFAYLAFERLPESLVGVSHEVSYRPVVFGALLSFWGQKGPAEIAPKRAWTYRHINWLAYQHNIELTLPAQHPFNPLAVLRLAWACAPDGGTPNRHVCETIFHHVWRGGAAVDDAARMATLESALAPQRDPRSDEVKGALRKATDDAIEQGVFGVPTIEADGRQFWGVDALPMLSASVRGDPWFDGPAWIDAATVPDGVQRRS
jgi:2-hydroxychromene-2-carboxylate isomerase